MNPIKSCQNFTQLNWNRKWNNSIDQHLFLSYNMRSCIWLLIFVCVINLCCNVHEQTRAQANIQNTFEMKIIFPSMENDHSAHQIYLFGERSQNILAKFWVPSLDRLSCFLGTALFVWLLCLFVCCMGHLHCMSCPCIDHIVVIWSHFCDTTKQKLTQLNANNLFHHVHMSKRTHVTGFLVCTFLDVFSFFLHKILQWTISPKFCRTGVGQHLLKWDCWASPEASSHFCAAKPGKVWHLLVITRHIFKLSGNAGWGHSLVWIW